MKKEFLEKLGLSSEAITAIISEHENKVNELEGALKDLTSENERQKEAIALFDNERESFNLFKSRIISDIVKDSRPSSKAAEAELIRQLHSCQDGNYKGVIDKMKLDDPNAFISDTSGFPIFSTTQKMSESEVFLSYSKIR